MKIANGWLSLGLVCSISWFALASFLYFDNLVHYPKSYIDHFQLSAIYDCFNYEDDFYRKEEAMEYAKAHGKEAEANFLIATGFRFLKPTFSLIGYLSLIIVPILFIWLIFYFLIGRQTRNYEPNQNTQSIKRRRTKTTKFSSDDIVLEQDNINNNS